MRRLAKAVTLALITALTGLGSALAQTANQPFTAPQYYATSFNLWQIGSNFGSGPNVFIFPGRTVCNSMGQNVTFFDFNTNAPVLIADANTANSEIVTPSAVTNTAGSCGFTASPSHTHYTFQVRSGTAGLQEAINVLKVSSGRPAAIILDRNWWQIANNLPGTAGSTIIGAAVGGPGVILQDITGSAVVTYVWGGSSYASGTWVNTAPTIAAGAAAGSGPTVANTSASTALSGVADVTTGTATTTGTLFTETWPANTLNYAATCTVASSGANSFTAFTIATTTSGGHNLLTVTATGTPTASTAYAFTYSCQ